MAQRRMFSLVIVDTDRFLEMPASAQALYFHLGMRADDEGFVDSPRKITAMAGCAIDDLRLLVGKGYVIPFESGVCVITDWKQNNFIRSDRFRETQYQAEKSLLSINPNGTYTLLDSAGIPNDNQVGDKMDTQVRLGKVSVGKDSKEKPFAPSDLNSSETRTAENPESPQELSEYGFGLVDNSMFYPSMEYVQTLAEAYPAVDIVLEIKRMAAWCEANKGKRKTRRGAQRFMNNWLERAQNSPRARTNTGWIAPPADTMTPEKIAELERQYGGSANYGPDG